MRITCERCLRRYDIPDEAIQAKGMRARCKCGARVTLLGGESAGVDSDAAPPPSGGRTRWFVDFASWEPIAMDEAQLQRAIASGRIDDGTLVWRKGMPSWQKLGEVAELELLRSATVRPPPSSRNDSVAVSPPPEPAQEPRPSSIPPPRVTDEHEAASARPASKAPRDKGAAGTAALWAEEESADDVSTDDVSALRSEEKPRSESGPGKRRLVGALLLAATLLLVLQRIRSERRPAAESTDGAQTTSATAPLKAADTPATAPGTIPPPVPTAASSEPADAGAEQGAREQRSLPVTSEKTPASPTPASASATSLPVAAAPPPAAATGEQRPLAGAPLPSASLGAATIAAPRPAAPTERRPPPRATVPPAPPPTRQAQWTSPPKLAPKAEPEPVRAPVAVVQSPVRSAPPGQPSPGQPSPGLRPVGPFDIASALQQMGVAAQRAKQCSSAGPERGTGRVSLRIRPWGRVDQVLHLSPGFHGTRVGVCVMQAFQQVRVVEFSGDDVRLEYDFTVP